MSLTTNQREFAALVARGERLTDAYKATFDTSRLKETSIGATASKEAQKVEVKRYIEMLKDKQNEVIQRSNIANTDSIIALIDERISICRENGNETAIAKYVDILNKMLGNYTYKDSGDTPENEIKNMSTEELKALLNAPIPS